jgi:hypothetical protein
MCKYQNYLTFFPSYIGGIGNVIQCLYNEGLSNKILLQIIDLIRMNDHNNYSNHNNK